MVVIFRPFARTGQGPDKDNPEPVPDDWEERMDVDGQTASRLVRIWAKTPPKQSADGAGDWKSLCIVNLAAGLIENGVPVATPDGSSKLRTADELFKASQAARDEIFDYALVKGRRSDEGFLSVIFTIELTTSWKAFISNEAIKEALSLYSWKIYDTEFQKPQLVSVGFLKNRTHERLCHSAEYQTESRNASKASLPKPSNTTSPSNSPTDPY